jgi:hypothetical protein
MPRNNNSRPIGSLAQGSELQSFSKDWRAALPSSILDQQDAEELEEIQRVYLI